MAKDDVLKFEGVVVKQLPNSVFKVKLDNGKEVMAHPSGKIRINSIRIIEGDRVVVEFSPYDLTKGRIVYRYR
ncbi:MAG: translation initiation factor IF-1 [Brevinematales bacterium]|nr:translation initiation factor IF-1 [Brevinematales bacterium]